MQKKHRAATEAWTLCAKMRNHNGSDRYFAVFFLTGKFFLFSGNFTHYSSLAMPSGKYNHESKTLLPPLVTVKHDYSTLNERLGKNAIIADNDSTTIHITACFKHLKSRFFLSKNKTHFSFRDVMTNDYSKRKFDWYLIPRCSVCVCLTGSHPDTVYGSGHFQQFWGKGGESNCDWFVVHTESGYDLIIACFPEERQRCPWLPGDYVMLCPPDGSFTKITRFDVTPLKWWTGRSSQKKYPLRYAVTIPDEEIDLTITSCKEDQTTTIGGREYWYGFGSVSGTIRKEQQSGWAYLAPLGSPK